MPPEPAGSRSPAEPLANLQSRIVEGSLRRAWLGGLALALIACATAKLDLVEAVKPAAREVTLSLIVLPGASVSDAQLAALRARLAARLAEGGVIVAAQPTRTSSIAEGRIADYEPGDRLTRFFLPYLAGQGVFESSWLVKDLGGGTIGQCRIYGSVGWGGPRGGYDDLLDEAGRLLAACLANRLGR